MKTNLKINETTLLEVSRYLDRKNPGCLILSGKSHMGKFTLAKEIAKHLLCNSPVNGNPCGICESCVASLATHPDYMELHPDDGTIRMDQIRALIEEARYAAVHTRHKVFVVDDANTMSQPAQNAMLKLVEDGNRDNIVIFVSHGTLLDTIQSRCTVIKFSAVDIEEEDPLLAALCYGRYGLVSRYKGSSFLKEVDKFIQTLSKMGTARDILVTMNAVKEKDRDYFFEKHAKEDILVFMELLERIFMEPVELNIGIKNIPEFCCTNNVQRLYSVDKLCKICQEISSGIYAINNNNYNKNDFLDLLFSMADVEV